MESIDNKKIQENNTNLYKTANHLNTNGLPDLDGIPVGKQNQTTQDYLKAVKRNSISPIAQPNAVSADED